TAIFFINAIGFAVLEMMGLNKFDANQNHVVDINNENLALSKLCHYCFVKLADGEERKSLRKVAGPSHSFEDGVVATSIHSMLLRTIVFESSLVLWQSDESGIRHLLYLVGCVMQIDVIASFVSGRLVRERIGLAMLSAVQSQ
ncbi:hypothetical protein HN51_055504, partial [Arachis hypogaea]